MDTSTGLFCERSLPLPSLLDPLSLPAGLGLLSLRPVHSLPDPDGTDTALFSLGKFWISFRLLDELGDVSNGSEKVFVLGIRLSEKPPLAPSLRLGLGMKLALSSVLWNASPSVIPLPLIQFPLKVVGFRSIGEISSPPLVFLPKAILSLPFRDVNKGFLVRPVNTLTLGRGWPSSEEEGSFASRSIFS